MKNYTNKIGFTLVETVVMLTIIAILASIAFPSVSGVLGNANMSVDNARAGLYESALKIYVSKKAQVGDYVYIDSSGDNKQLVANTIAHVLDEEKVDFSAKSKKWKFWYYPNTLQIVALEEDGPPGWLDFYQNGQVLEGRSDGPLLDVKENLE